MMPDDLQRDPSGRVIVKADDGSLSTVPESQLDRYLSERGGSLASGDDVARANRLIEAGESGPRALLESVGRGLTLGASDAIQAYGAGIGTELGNQLADYAGIGETQRAVDRGLNAPVVDMNRADQALAAEKEARADLLARKEANPIASTVGEVGGAIGLGLLTGGLGTEAAAARLGAGGVTSALGRAGVAVGKGAFEGALYGAAQAVDNDFLNDQEITAERIAMGAQEGALLGGAFGGASSLIGTGAKAAGRAVADKVRFAGEKLSEAGRGAYAAGSRAAGAIGEALGMGKPVATEVASEVGVDAAASAAAQAAGSFESRVSSTVDELSKLSSSATGDAAAEAEFAFEPLYESKGALVSRDLAQAERKKAAALFAQARAASGGFEDMQQQAVRDIGEAGDEFVKITQRMDDQVAIAAKRAKARELNLQVHGPRKIESLGEASLESFNPVIGGKKGPAFVADKADAKKFLARHADDPDYAWRLERVPLDEIDAPSSWSESKLKPVKEALEGRKPLPAIRADIGESGKYIVDDGLHRVAAAREAGLDSVWAYVPTPRSALNENLVKAGMETESVFSNLGEQLTRLKRLGPSLNDASGGATVKQLSAQLAHSRAKFREHIANGELGDAAMVLDDLKRAIDNKAAVSRNPIVRQALQGDGQLPGMADELRKHLEDESVFGSFGTMQKRVNATYAEAIRRSKDDMLRGVLYEGGESSANPFRQLKKLNRNNVGSLLRRLGDEEVVPQEEAFRRYLRAREIDAVNRAQAWGSQEAQELASKLSGLREKIEENMNAVALMRRDRDEFARLVQEADIPGPVGWVGKGALSVTQKLANVSEAASRRNIDLSALASGELTSAASAAGNASALAAAKTTALSGDSLVLQAARSFANAARKTVDVSKRAASAAARSAERVGRGVESAATAAGRSAPIAGTMMFANKPASVERGIQALSRMTDPMSDERKQLREQYSQLAAESPEHAAAMERYVQSASDYLMRKAPSGLIDLSTPFAAAAKQQYAKSDVQSFLRSVRAVQNPAAAMQRIASGEWVQEDLDAIRTLQPRLWGRFVSQVTNEIAKMREKPPYKQRLRMSRVLGAPMTSFDTPSFQTLINELASGSIAQAQEAQSSQEQPAKLSYTSATGLGAATANLQAGSDQSISRGQ